MLYYIKNRIVEVIKPSVKSYSRFDNQLFCCSDCCVINPGPTSTFSATVIYFVNLVNFTAKFYEDVIEVALIDIRLIPLKSIALLFRICEIEE